MLKFITSETVYRQVVLENQKRNKDPSYKLMLLYLRI